MKILTIFCLLFTASMATENSQNMEIIGKDKFIFTKEGRDLIANGEMPLLTAENISFFEDCTHFYFKFLPLQFFFTNGIYSEYREYRSLPSAIGQLINLREIKCYTCLEGPIPPEIGLLVNLTTLSLYESKLRGEIPKEIGNLVNLETLSLHTNQLTGEIPKEIGALVNLRSLRLDENQLSGEIPKEIGALSELRCLNLSNNKLTGEIPTELTQLKWLEQLRINQNNLTITDYKFLNFQRLQFFKSSPPQKRQLFLFNCFAAASSPSDPYARFRARGEGVDLPKLSRLSNFSVVQSAEQEQIELTCHFFDSDLEELSSFEIFTRLMEIGNMFTDKIVTFKILYKKNIFQKGTLHFSLTLPKAENSPRIPSIEPTDSLTNAHPLNDVRALLEQESSSFLWHKSGDEWALPCLTAPQKSAYSGRTLT